MKFITNISNFRAGVLSPKLNGRTDVREYSNALSIGKNAFIAKEGGAYKRLGLSSIADFEGTITDATVKSITLFSDRTLFFIFLDYGFKVMDSYGNNLTENQIPYDGANTYDHTQFSLSVVENTIVLTDFSGKMPPYYLEIKESDVGVLFINKKEYLYSDFGFSPYAIPMDDANIDPDKRIRVSNIQDVNNLQLESTFSLFTADMVNEQVMLTGIIYVEGSIKISSNIYKIKGYVSPTIVNVESLHTVNGQDGGGSPLEFDSLANVTFNTSNSTYTPIGAVSNSFDEWSFGMWSDRLGWPKTSAVDENRLVLGGNKAYPASIWGSKTGSPKFFLDKRLSDSGFSFLVGTNGNVEYFGDSLFYSGDIEVSDPYNFSLSSKHGAEITFMESSVNFIVGTNRSEYIISGDGKAISQYNITARPHTSHGSSPILSATYDNTVVYVSRNKKSVFLFKYSDKNGSFVSKDVTILNSDIVEDGIKSIAWHEELSSICIVTNAGNIVSLALENSSDTSAFTELFSASERVISVAYGIDGSQEFLGVLIERNSKLYLEKISLIDEASPYQDFDGEMDRVSSMDALRIFSPLTTSTIASISLNTIGYDSSKLKIGDTVIFTSLNPNILDTNNFDLNTQYWVVPQGYPGTLTSGFAIASSLANAQSATIIPIFDSLFVDDILDAEITRDNQTIPIKHIPAGQEVTVFASNENGLIESTFVSDGNDTFDLGIPVKHVAYGYPYKFHIATMPVEAGQQWGSAQLGVKRIDKAGVYVYKTRSYKIGTDGYNMEERLGGEVTTEKDIVALTGNPEYDHIVHITNEKAEPCYISNLALRGVSNDG